ncbi:MAG: ABC transporter permease, partial [Flavobacteriales bacterium]
MLKNYFKIAFRNLWRRRGFSSLNILGLAIGMTAAFLMLLYVAFELSYDQMHSKSDRIYRVVSDVHTPSETLEIPITTWPAGPGLVQDYAEVSMAVRIARQNLLLTKDEIQFQEENSILADSGFFQMFDFEIVSGNSKTILTAPYSIVLSESTAEKYFGEENPVGKSIEVYDDGRIATVTGVMKDIPENSHFSPDVLLSFSTLTEDLNPEIESQWGNYGCFAFILTAPGVDHKELETKFSDFFPRHLSEEESQEISADLFLEPLTSVYLHSDRGGNGGGDINRVYVFSVVAIFILLIACINFINLTTARSVERAKEVGIRKVIGAEKGQLAWQFMGEAIIVCLLAFVISVLLSTALLDGFNDISGKIIAEGIFSSPSYILVLLGIAIFIGLLAGIYPAIILSSFRPVSVLKGRFSSGKKGILLRKGLVVTQFTISTALIIGTIVIYDQMSFMQSKELGFNKEQMLVLETNGVEGTEALKSSIEDLPGVVSTSLTSSVPGSDHSTAYTDIENSLGEMQGAAIDLYFIDYEFTNLFNLEIVAGRAFSKEFGTDSTEAMLINETAAAFLGYKTPEEALGARFDQWGRQGQVIGVLKDFHIRSLEREIPALSMRIEEDNYSLLAVNVSSENLSETISSIESEWGSVIPEKPFDYYFLDTYFNRQYESQTRFGNLFLAFAILAIFISCLGLLGLAAYSTIQRRREIGIRKVIGSSVLGIVRLLSIDFIKLVGIAFIIACPIMYILMNYWLEDFAYRISLEWWMFLMAGGAAFVIAILTVSFHALKASIANPV